MTTPAWLDDADVAVDRILEALGNKIVLGTPLGIGKPNQFLNALYRRAKSDPKISLKIVTALSLERPRPAPGLEARFLEPVFTRLFDGYEGLDYVVDLKAQKIPSNIEICEFFFKSGSMMANDYAQQHYISSNYTHVARDMIDQGCNLLVQQVARGQYQGSRRLSWSSNTDVTVDILPLIKAEAKKGRTIKVLLQINEQLPFMVNDALVDEHTVDYIIDNPNYYSRVFAPPNMPVSPVDYAIGMHCSALVRDGGTLQIGIGSLGDAIVQCCLLRHERNNLYKEALEALGGNGYRPLRDRLGGDEPFKSGLYGSSEMFVNGFLHLMQRGILKRKVYENEVIQRLVNAGTLAESLQPDHLDALIDGGFFGEVLTAERVETARHYGIFNTQVQWRDDQLWLQAEPLGRDPHAAVLRQRLRAEGMGPRLLHGIVMHGGFFLGPEDFYQALRDMPIKQLEEICMTSVGHVNQLLINEELVIEQRRHARFINTGLMATLGGAVVSDGLANGRLVSGVGGQYNFVSMAHALPDARSILSVRATRSSKGKTVSNIVWNYGHVTIPRHLRDILVTEYGVADLRGRTDSEVIKAVLNITDSRFQQELLAQAKTNGKVAKDYEIPLAHRDNTPARIQATIARFQSQDGFPSFPLGCAFTPLELEIGAALKRLKALQQDKPAFLKAVLRAWFAPIDDARATPHLERMALTGVQHGRTKLEKNLLLQQLAELGKLGAQAGSPGSRQTQS